MERVGAAAGGYAWPPDDIRHAAFLPMAAVVTASEDFRSWSTQRRSFRLYDLPAAPCAISIPDRAACWMAIAAADLAAPGDLSSRQSPCRFLDGARRNLAEGYFTPTASPPQRQFWLLRSLLHRARSAAALSVRAALKVAACSGKSSAPGTRSFLPWLVDSGDLLCQRFCWCRLRTADRSEVVGDAARVVDIEPALIQRVVIDRLTVRLDRSCCAGTCWCPTE